MKTRSILITLCVLAMCSCQKSEWVGPSIDVTPPDIAFTELVYAYCPPMADNTPFHSRAVYDQFCNVRTYPQINKIHKDEWCIFLSYQGYYPHMTNTEYNDWLGEHEPQTDNMAAEYNRIAGKRDFIGMMVVKYLGVVGATVTADKKLFGRAVGENLSDCFRVKAYAPDVIFSYPECKVVGALGADDKPLLLSQWAECSPTMQSIYLMFDSVPEENYESVTFTFNIQTTDNVTQATYSIDIPGFFITE